MDLAPSALDQIPSDLDARRASYPKPTPSLLGLSIHLHRKYQEAPIFVQLFLNLLDGQHRPKVCAVHSVNIGFRSFNAELIMKCIQGST